jgi:hypothetical protein
LRERLNEIAAGVVRLTQTMGPSGVPDAPQSNGGGEHGESQSQPAPTEAPPTAPAGEQAGDNRTLADRLRALQHAAARH